MRQTSDDDKDNYKDKDDDKYNYKDFHLLRFLPVKQTSDLLLVMSNLYSLDHGALIMSPMVATIFS